MQVANRSHGHEEVNGVRLYGLDAEMHRKMESKRDREFEKQLAQWVAAATKEKVDLTDPIGSFRSGIILCKLANAIQPDIIRKINTRPIALLEMENIGFYLKACWKLGVASAELFVTSDLYLRKGEPQVFVNLLSLARIADSTTSYKGPTMKSLGFKALGKPVEKRTTQWSNVIQEQGPLYITDIERQEQEQQRQQSPRSAAGGHPAKLLPAKSGSSPLVPPASPRGGSPRPSAELEAVKILERQLEDERKRSVTAVAEIKRLQKDLETAKGQLDAERKRGAAASSPAGAAGKEEPRNRAGTVVDTQALYEKIRTLELKKEKELEEACAKFEARLREERRKWEEEAERARADLMNDIQYWKTEAESKDLRLTAQQKDVGQSEEWERRTAERRKREMELAQRKEAAAKALLEREKKKAEQDKVEIERLKAELAAVTRENQELRQARDQALSKSSSMSSAVSSVQPVAPAKPEEEDVGIFERLRKNTIVNVGRPAPTSPRNQIATLRWANKQKQDDEELVAALNECVHAVLYSSTEVYFSDIVQLNEIFKTDYGRRQFAFALKQTMKKLPSLCLSSDAFDMMLYLMNRMLVEAETSNDKDFIALSALMRAATSLYRMDRQRPSYLQEFVKDFTVWKNSDFWEEYFLHEMLKKRKNETKETARGSISGGDADDAALASVLLPYIISHMFKWDTPLEVGEQFVRSIGERFSLPADKVKEALAVLAEKMAEAKYVEEPAQQAAEAASPLEETKAKTPKKTRTKRSPRGEGAAEEKPAAPAPVGVIKSFQPPTTMLEKEKRIEETRKQKKAEEKKDKKADEKKEKKDKKGSVLALPKKKEKEKEKEKKSDEADKKKVRMRSRTDAVPIPKKGEAEKDDGAGSTSPLFFGRS